MATVRRAGEARPRAQGASGQQASPAAVRASLAPGTPGAIEDGPLIVERDDGRLRWLDSEHARVEADGQGGQRSEEQATSVLVLPAVPGPTPGVLRREVVVDGWRFEVDVEPAARAALRERATRARDDGGHSGPTEVRAIIPGVVVSVAVAAGDVVAAGQQLLAVEAMKMQNELRAPRAGTIERVAVAPGRTIEVGELLLVIG